MVTEKQDREYLKTVRDIEKYQKTDSEKHAHFKSIYIRGRSGLTFLAGGGIRGVHCEYYWCCEVLKILQNKG